MEIAQFLTSTEFIWGYSIFVVGGFAVASGFLFVSRVRAMGTDLDTATEIVLKAGGRRTKPQEARTSIAEAWHRGHLDKLYKIEGIAHAWYEFVECLIIPTTEETDKGIPIRNTRDPAHYFNREHIATRLGLRFFDSVPGILTGLGILGTFLGLAAGIFLAQAEGLTGENTDQVLAALQQLLNGASLAFFTSIAGLSTSIVYLFFMRLFTGSVDRSLFEWNRVLDRSLERTTPEQVAVRQLHELSRVAEATESLRNNQSSATEDMLTSIVEKFNETMTGAAGKQFEAIANSLGTLNEMLKSTITSMQEQEESSAKALAELSGNVTQTLSEGSDQIRKSFEQSIQMMMDATKATHDDLSSRFEQMTESLASAAKNNSEQLGQQIGSAIGRASDELNSVSGNIGSAIGRASDELDSASGKMAAAIEDVGISAASQIGSAIGRASDGLDSVSGKMAAALEDAGTSAASRIEESATSLAGRVEGLAKSLSDAEKLTTRLAEAAEIVQAAAADVGSVLEGLETVTPALTRSSSKMASAGDAISKASETLGQFGKVATAAAKQISSTNDEVRENWEMYLDRFEGADKALASVVGEMETGLEMFTERVIEFNRGVDRDFSRAVQILTAAIEELDQTLDERDGQ